ncbi:type IX secretion system outer membrane channel protein PorV [Mucilaginibacter arboris]|uniref:Type IX secretion system outer membrane channel protein PorV n=1 Tax=Mucilaginibacter arboris TaxID=2682090 RepID=A0A7K1SS66_9SPHI|nr:type IX secretion system outer membrane channel protein PorV [Mucilaginibacter arboris]MVN20067.1 type IX secretion system outer membrane channel protein PorV [Mucilaginibacter arboris]
MEINTIVKRFLILTISLGFSIFYADAQVNGTNTNGSSSSGAILTAVPFLTVSPDARSGAIGDAGVALSSDKNANYWNPSKLAFIENGDQVSLSYSPWLRRLVPDINLAYLSYAHKLDNRNTIGLSLRYFNLGKIQLVDINQQDQGTYTPNEFSIDATFARKFGENFSLGTSLRYIYSNLSSGTFSEGQQTKPGQAIAADVSLYYKKPTQMFGQDDLFAFGLNISNIGSKMSYTETGQKYFLPTNLKVGVANTWFLDNYNELTAVLDVNKLLVPTNPNSTASVPAGIFGSFTDAGFTGELKEINFGGGLEYWYNHQFALRGGYFYENPNRGNRNYLTLGAGFRFDAFNLDFSYLVANEQQSALANTLRFTLGYTFGKDYSK